MQHTLELRQCVVDVSVCPRSNEAAVCISDPLFPFNLPRIPSTLLLPYTYYVSILIIAADCSPYAKDRCVYFSSLSKILSRKKAGSFGGKD